MDQWNPYIPQPNKTWPNPVTPWPWPNNPYAPPAPATSPPTIVQPQVAEGVDNKTVKELIDTLRQAIEAAERFDKLTGQPDCVDPEKATLMERVEELERRLKEIEDVQDNA